MAWQIGKPFGNSGYVPDYFRITQIVFNLEDTNNMYAEIHGAWYKSQAHREGGGASTCRAVYTVPHARIGQVLDEATFGLIGTLTYTYLKTDEPDFALAVLV